MIADMRRRGKRVDEAEVLSDNTPALPFGIREENREGRRWTDRIAPVVWEPQENRYGFGNDIIFVNRR
jgi:hypothetical protein